MRLLRCGWLLLTLVSLLGFGSQAMAISDDYLESKSVLVSVHPLALLVKSAWPHLEVTSLVPANQSPHDFSLRPSDLLKVSQADSVVWLGSDFEPYLIKLMAKKSQQVDLSDISQKTAEHSSHDDHANHDPHLWLQPHQIPALLKAVQRELKLESPQAFLNAYNQFINQSKIDLALSKDKGFVSFHDAFHYWVAFYKLNQLEVVTLNPEKPVGTRHVVQVRNILASGKASCLFVEPQFQTRLLKKLTQGLSVQQVNIDPMASKYKINGANFIGFYKSLSQQFQQCFSQ